ncbi:signal peptidase I [Ketogulonicigenium vulgare]|uniref:Signal peptidase I n=1 Tax=Ketogulonicigenium vulgare (strain WSH-001) TaxID=759362 RepID=F9Y8I9_KETVW|nr:signal peptidase I [Ketogulonicigenium vulgare]ADO41765.1 signal peptidase I [Ketogulonicigenium vulgare Y25]AEM39998.1 Signal peptidase I, putative [Ketogulonicigenium vulgare WSH-001]ALJ80203.1 S26 family signal peptidase [Ketogulonicigenium vulgare]ANW33065.1 signal peptidase I [Ketogulonicigenium vulgare]AOZ53696.1 signal peptidase I [Ketogulonicigenium vulgare]
MAEKSGALHSIVETAKTIVFALLIAGAFRTILFQPFYIPSGSMKDTLLIGDFLFVNKMAYGYSYASCPTVNIGPVNIDAQAICSWVGGDNDRLFGSQPDRGDIIVFRHPRTGEDYIKRLIGLPGDTVQVRDGVVFINGEEAPQEPNGSFHEVMERQGPQGLLPSCANGPVGMGADCRSERLIETLPGGTSHSILNIGDQPQDNTPVYTVPAGHYFFMGDNRDNSADSRWLTGGGVGFVPYENLIGRADRVIFSSAGRSLLQFWTWRPDRFFKALD